MSKFEDRFKKVIKEGIEDDQLAMADTLDDGVSVTDYDDVDAAPDPDAENLHRQVAQANAAQAEAMAQTIKDWIAEFDEFLVLLNGTDNNSIQSVLARAEADTILDKMKQSEQRKIARVATELAALTESFKGYLAQSTNSSLKYV